MYVRRSSRSVLPASGAEPFVKRYVHTFVSVRSMDMSPFSPPYPALLTMDSNKTLSLGSRTAPDKLAMELGRSWSFAMASQLSGSSVPPASAEASWSLASAGFRTSPVASAFSNLENAVLPAMLSWTRVSATSCTIARIAYKSAKTGTYPLLHAIMSHTRSGSAGCSTASSAMITQSRRTRASKSMNASPIASRSAGTLFRRRTAFCKQDLSTDAGTRDLAACGSGASHSSPTSS
mmetsp:Transcript_13114/g.48661  ORF Transcript_13114/g.48661 Transcript_13114/m.48661 type:complete len:235 (-) Transcript_13114:446-1150(-)